MKLHILRLSHRKCRRRKELQALTKTKTQIFLQLPVQNLYLELELKTKDSLLLVKNKRMVEVSYRKRKKKINDLSHFVKRPKYLLSLPQINIHSICISRIWEQNLFFFHLVLQCIVFKKKKNHFAPYIIYTVPGLEKNLWLLSYKCARLCTKV